MTGPLLSVEELTVVVRTDNREVPVVEGVSFTMERERTLALVGESGCGKSMLVLAMTGLLPDGLRVAAGSVRLCVGNDHVDVLELDDASRRELLGRRLGTVFQDPATHLNPVLTVGTQVEEGLRRDGPSSRPDARARAIGLLRDVGLPRAEEIHGAFPHELSGGMRQRALLAAALAGEPEVLLADEPTTALDVTTQARVLRLLSDIRRERGLSLLIVSHDLGTVAQVADDVAVMYAGRLVERGPVRSVLNKPFHPYTRGLLAAGTQGADGRFRGLDGEVPAPGARPGGCSFHPRCSLAETACRDSVPALAEVDAGHEGACPVAEREA